MERSDRYRIKFDEVRIETFFNIRYDMGSLQELAESIINNGIVSPVTGYETKEDDGKTYITLTDGHRRYYAVKWAIDHDRLDRNSFRIPLIKVRPQSIEKRTLSLITTNMGKPLTMLEEAEVIERLLDYGMPESEIAQKIAKSATHIANCRLLLTAGIGLRKFVKDGNVAPTLMLTMLREHSPKVVENKLKRALKKKTEKADKEAAAANTNTLFPHLDTATVSVTDKGELLPSHPIKITARNVREFTPKEKEVEQPVSQEKGITYSLMDMQNCFIAGQDSISNEHAGSKTFEDYIASRNASILLASTQNSAEKQTHVVRKRIAISHKKDDKNHALSIYCKLKIVDFVPQKSHQLTGGFFCN